MSSTIKERLAAIKTSLDSLFVSANANEKPELVKELRDYLSRQNSAAKRPSYDKANVATSSGI